MKKKRFAVEQIVVVLEEVEADTPSGRTKTPDRPAPARYIPDPLELEIMERN